MSNSAPPTWCAPAQDGYGGTILDSGTTFTYVPGRIFETVRDLVAAHVEARGLYRVEGGDPDVSACLIACVAAVNSSPVSSCWSLHCRAACSVPDWGLQSFLQLMM